MYTSAYLEGHPLVAWASIAAMALGASLVLWAPWISRLFSRKYPLYAIIFFGVSRLGLYAAIIVIVGYAAGTDKGVWLLHGESAASGLLPYVDYHSEYGPLFSYLLAPAFMALGGYAGPLLVFTLFDLLVFVMLSRVGDAPEIARRAAVLYLITPLSWFNVIRYGQDESIGAFFVVLMLLALKRKRHNVLGALAGLGTLVTKPLFLLPAVPLLANSGRRVRSSLLAVAIILAGYLPFALLGGEVFHGLSRVSHLSGASVWLLLQQVFVLDSVVRMLVFAGVMVLFCIVIALRGRQIGTINAVLLLFAALMITAPKAWPAYVLLVLPVLCIKIARRDALRWRVWFAVYGFTMIFHHLTFGSLKSAEAWSVMWTVDLTATVGLVVFHAHILVDSLMGIRAPAASGVRKGL